MCLLWIIVIWLNTVIKSNSNLEKEKLSLESLIKKDKEIEELKIKLSRFPFELNEREKLMSVIFQSTDQNIHLSVICKNTDKFNKIEVKYMKRKNILDIRY